MRYIILCFLVAFTGCNQNSKADKAAHEISRAEDKARFEKWAYVAKEKEIAAGEKLKLVIIPSPDGDVFDTKCLIYSNSTTNTSTLTCPSVDSTMLSEKAE